MTTGSTAWKTYPPQVEVVERMLLSQLPEEQREPFLRYLGDRVQRNRAGEVVFNKKAYLKWMQQ